MLKAILFSVCFIIIVKGFADIGFDIVKEIFFHKKGK